MRARLRPVFIFLSMALCRAMGGEKDQYLCQRCAEVFGPYSLPCRVLDWLCGEPGHCRRQLFDWHYRR